VTQRHAFARLPPCCLRLCHKILQLLFLWSSGASYADVAFAVLRKWVGDDEVPAGDLRALVDAAYAPIQPQPKPVGAAGGSSAAATAPGTWDTPAIAPLVPLAVPPGISSDSDSPPVYLLEQFHGPTCAFKDHALQLLGHLFSYLLARKAGGGSGSGSTATATMTILGATSGDTGSAAIAGLRGKPGVEVFILHPRGRVAAVQEMQVRGE
jgi:threonine synthase